MLSSISSSKERAPNTRWYLVWLSTLSIVFIVLAILEFSWRDAGHKPSVTDDISMWTQKRQLAIPRDGKSSSVVALLGASRLQLSISLDVLEQEFPENRFIQLSVDGHHPLAALRDLSIDPNFDGIILCSVTIGSFTRRRLWDQQPWVDYYHRSYTLNTNLNRSVSTAIQSRFAIVNPRIRLTEVVKGVVEQGRLPQPFYITTFHDRSRLADYDNTNVDELKRNYYQKKLLASSQSSATSERVDAILKILHHIKPWVDSIKHKGGKVVFVRLPTSEAHLKMTQQSFPRHLIWDRISGITGATTLHFLDYPSLQAFNLPDYSHVNGVDVNRFTRELSIVLKNEGVLIH